jgi:hypothetical protein
MKQAMMTSRILNLPLFMVGVLGGFASAGASGELICTPRIFERVLDGTPEEIARWGPAKERLLRIQGQVGQQRWNRIANDCIDVVDPNLGKLERVTVRDWVQLTARDNATDDQIAEVILALDDLRDSSGLLHMGLIRKSGLSDGSRRWLIDARAGNRGHLFEIVGARNLIQDGYVQSTRIVGFQIVMEEIQGDRVVRLDSGLYRFIDFKAYNGNFDTAVLDKVFAALRPPGTEIDEIVFALEEGVKDSQEWKEWVTKFDEVTQALIDAGLTPEEAKRKLSLVSAGSFAR